MRFNQIVAQLIFFLFLLPAFVSADINPLPAGNKYVEVQLVTDVAHFEPPADETQKVARIGVLFRIEPGWHIYWENSGEAAIPTKIDWETPNGWSVGELNWPAPIRFIERGNIITYGYKEEVVLFADLSSPIVIPQSDQKIHIAATVSWLVCKETCVPGKKTVTLDGIFSTTLPLRASESAEVFTKYEKLVPQSLSTVSVSAIADVETVAPGSMFNISLLIKGLRPSGTSLAESLQVFPKKHHLFTLGHVSVDPSSGNSEKVTLSAPVSVAAKQIGNENKVPLSGILLIAPELTGLKTLVNIPWSLDVEVGEQTKLNRKYSKEVIQASPQVELTFHQIDTTIKQDVPRKQDQFVFTTFLIVLFSAFVAGMILNLMPCVLPVVAIKIMGFVGHAEKGSSDARRSAWAYTGGVLFSFALLASLVVVMKSLGHALGWGFQFQYPGFVIVLIFVVFFLTLGFFDLYAIRLPFLQRFTKKIDQARAPLVKSFLDGILATALATPCTAPFLGTALAFAFAQNTLIIFSVFLTIGLGLSLPYVYLSSHPGLLKLLPAPGRWMYNLKRVLGFFLFCTVIWLLYVLNQLTQFGLISTLILLCVLTVLLWLHKKLLLNNQASGAVDVFLTTCFLLCVYFAWPQLTELRRDSVAVANDLWTPYSEQVVSEAIRSKQTVFIDFTADWCITCKANENFVLNSKSVLEDFNKHKVLLVKADWTRGDDQISNALRRYGGEGVPHYVLIAPNDGQPKILPTLLTRNIIREALESVSE